MNTIEKTNNDHMNMATMSVHAHQTQSLASKVGRFTWHLVQMVLVMEAGMMVYHHLLWPVLAPTGFSSLTKEYPLFGYWMMVASMTLPMIALMRGYHKSTWRYCLEMTIAMLAPLAVLTVLVWYHLLPIQTLYGIGDPVMFLAMAAYLLYRPHQHTPSGHEHTGRQPASSVEAAITKQTTDKLNEAREENQGKHACHTA
jgi:hypothetical protein